MKFQDSLKATYIRFLQFLLSCFATSMAVMLTSRISFLIRHPYARYIVYIATVILFILININFSRRLCLELLSFKKYYAVTAVSYLFFALISLGLYALSQYYIEIFGEKTDMLYYVFFKTVMVGRYFMVDNIATPGFLIRAFSADVAHILFELFMLLVFHIIMAIVLALSPIGLSNDIDDLIEEEKVDAEESENLLETFEERMKKEK